MMDEDSDDFGKYIAKLAAIGTHQAYNRALDLGHCVLIAKDGEIRRVHPDGSSEFVKKIAPNLRMRKGTVIRVK